MNDSERKAARIRAYQDDLAYVHDVGFTDYVRDAIPGLFAMLRRHGIKGGLVVDLGCGSGVWARELTNAGYDALGVDLSPGMLRLARKRAPNAQFLRASLLDAKLPSCKAVTAIGEPLNYLFDSRNSSFALLRLFRRIHQALVPGGVFIFDVAGPGRTGQRGPLLTHREGPDWAILVRTREEGRNQTLVREMTVFRKGGRNYRRSQETHRLRLYPQAVVASKLRAAGFQVQVVQSYGNSKARPGLLVYVARKI